MNEIKREKFVFCVCMNVYKNTHTHTLRLIETRTMDSHPPVVVIDTGTLYTKAGFAGDELPKVTFPTRIVSSESGSASDDVIGQQVLDQGMIGSAVCPMDEWGVVQDWDKMERIWRDVFIKYEISIIIIVIVIHYYSPSSSSLLFIIIIVIVAMMCTPHRTKTTLTHTHNTTTCSHFHIHTQMYVWYRSLILSALQVDSSETPVLLSEAPLCPKFHRERMCQLMFEQFNVPGLYISTSSVLSLYAAGRTTGVVLDIGDRTSDFVPIYEGFCVTHAIERLDMAGRNVTQQLKKQLIESNRGTLQNCEQLITDNVVDEIKRKHCYVALEHEHTLARLEHHRKMKTNQRHRQQIQDGDSQNQQQQQQDQDDKEDAFGSSKSKRKSKLDDCVYQLPDGQKIKIDAKLRFDAPEMLFRPWRYVEPGMEVEGIHRLLYESITKCGSDLRKEMTGNIILSGGSTLFSGFIDRLELEMDQLTPIVYQPVNVLAPKERQNGAWIGGSILASLNTFHHQNAWIQKREYNESGPQIGMFEDLCCDITVSTDDFIRLSPSLHLNSSQKMFLNVTIINIPSSRQNCIRLLLLFFSSLEIVCQTNGFSCVLLCISFIVHYHSTAWTTRRRYQVTIAMDYDQP